MLCNLEISIHTLYNGRPIRTMFFDQLAQTICISEITSSGKKLTPEQIMRKVHIFYPDFIKFHNYLEETLSLYDEWHIPLRTTFTVKGGWVIPKAPLILTQQTVASLGNYARWFWPLSNGWIMTCVFTQNQINDLVMETTETEYTGMCTMDAELSIVQKKIN